MTGSVERAAIYLALGIVAASGIATWGVMKSTNTLGKSLERAGSNAQSHSSSPHIPSSFRVELSEQASAARQLTSDDRKRLQDEFVRKLTGMKIDDAEVQSVEILRFAIDTYTDGSLQVECKLLRSDGVVEEDVSARLRPDGFGGYVGNVGTRQNMASVLKDLRIE